MKKLILVTVIWALSFSLIGRYITPNVDPYLAVLIRILCGLLLFSNYLKPMPTKDKLFLSLIGAFQFGLTYVLLYRSYYYLDVIQILLFTITTPIYIVIIHCFFQKKINVRALLAALLAIAGAFMIRYDKTAASTLPGFFMIQASNLCFAFGQVLYQKKKLYEQTEPQQQFFWFFIGALLISLPAFLIFGNMRLMATPSVIASLLYAGFIATGLGQFFWCLGTKEVTNSQLSVMNNLVIPVGIAMGILFGYAIDNIFYFCFGTLIILIALATTKNP